MLSVVKQNQVQNCLVVITEIITITQMRLTAFEFIIWTEAPASGQ